MKVTLGGDRIHSGKKMEQELHEYGRSSFNKSYVWKSTMAAGTLVPFFNEVGLPGSTHDVSLGVNVMTHPTIGPLFGSYKVELDMYSAPIRLYQALLQINLSDQGLKMDEILFPVMTLQVAKNYQLNANDYDNSQINPSCILSYFDIRGIGRMDSSSSLDIFGREFCCIPLLMYHEIVKNYYCNQQEKKGYVIHNDSTSIITTVTGVKGNNGGGDLTIPQGTSGASLNTYPACFITINYTA